MLVHDTETNDPNTMESFQDGGQQNMNSEHNEYPPTMEGSHMNPEMNNFSPNSGEGSMVADNFSKMPEGMHASQMQSYPGFNRGNYGMADQHGGMMSGNVDYGSQNSQFSGQFSQSAVRPSYPGMAKAGMSPVRPGMMPPGMGMIPGSYSSSQRMMSGPGMAQQSGPTPTLNQLLQTPNSGQRFPGNYGDYPAQGKGSDMGAGSSYPMSQGWNGNPRSMGPYPQGSMPGTPYRSQSGGMPETRRPSGMSPGPGPGYPHQNQYISPAMAANAQRYMMGQVRPGQTPMSGHGYNQQMPGPPCGPPHSQMNYPTPMPNPSSQPPSQQQQQQQQQMYHGQQQQPQPPGQPPPQPSPTPSQQQHAPHRPPSSQGASPKQSSPAPPGMADQSSNHSTSSKKSEENTESNIENSNADDGNSENSREAPTLASQSHLGVGSVRPAPSPAGSTGSRSNTPAPASASHSQAGSPMPPRPPSSQLEGQSHLSHSPMATQGFNQQMMPPPMGGQMGYGPGGPGGKMGGPGMTGQIPPHYPQYNSQYPQPGVRDASNFGRQQGMPSMQAGGTPGSGMPGTPGSGMPGSYPPQSMYNGPGSQMGGMPPGSNSYGMMSRGMQNYNMPYGPGNMNMSSQYGGFSSHMGPGQGPGPGPGPGSGPGPGHSGMGSGSGPVPMPPSQMMGGQGAMPPMAGMQQGPGGQMIPGKGAQAAAQAALMAAANSAGTRPHAPGRGSSPRMFGPHGAGSPSPGVMNHMGNLGNPSLNSMSNQINQITSSSVTSVPSKPASPASSGHGPQPSGTPTPSDSTSTNGAPPSVGVGTDTANLMSPMSNSDTQESTSRPSSTATPGQTADATNSTSDATGSDGSGSMPSSDSTSVDSGFHSAADQNEKPPSESTPNNSSPPSLVQPPSANGLCEEKPSQDSDKLGVRGDGVTTPSSMQPASTTTAVTATGTAVTQSITTPVSSEMESSGSQTSMPMPMMMSTGTNGPHYPHHPHPPHPNMGYMGPHSGPGPMGNAHMMPGPGMHHPGMPNNVGNMPYNMPPGGMPNNMPPGSMPNNMPHGSMPNSMMPGGMPNAMGPGSMPPGSMASGMINNGPASSMANSMPPGGMPNNIPPGSMPNNMPPGSMANSINSNAMGPMGTPQNNCIPMPSHPDEPPEKKKKDEGVMVSPACTGPGPSYSDDYENCGSPSWPGMPKSSADLSRLYEMGNEMDRRPFLDKLLAFLEEKGTPITSMPSISKQPLDLYRLYHCVREKGGMVEVNKGKKWKEICTFVNIGSSASAAFTLKKNYIRYLFGFECRHDRGNLDPAPILAEMEAQLEKKREQKKRVPSPGSQSSQDAFQPPSTPNNQMMDSFPPGPGGMPPPYMQGPGPDGSIGPGPMGGHGPGMMMPNNMNSMMGHPGPMMGSQSNMPPHPGAMGAGPGPGMMGPGPNSMMMPGSGPMNSAPPSQNMPPSGMMGGNMQAQSGMMNASSSMMGPNGMMGPGMHGQGMMGAGPGPNSYGPPTSMMGPNTTSMGPSPGPCPPMMASSSSSSTATPSTGANTVANNNSSTSSTGSAAPPTTSNCIPLPPSSTPSSRPPTSDSVSVQDPFADEPSSSPSPAQFPQRPGSTSASTQQPSVSTSSAPMPGFGSRPSSASNSSTSSFPSMPPSSVAASDQATNTFRRPMEGFPPTSAAPFSGRPEGAQFPFGQQYERERFDPSSSALPGQQFRHASQPASGPTEPAYPARFSGQQSPYRSQSEPYSSSQPFGAHGAAFGPRMPGPQEQYPSYPSPQQQQQPGAFSGVRPPPPMGRDMSGPYSGPGSAGPQYSDWSGGVGMGHVTYSSHLDGPSDSYMSGREGVPWSPMQQQRYPPGSGSNYMPPTAPSTPPMGPYGRPMPHRASPQARDKFIPTQKMHPKGGSVMPTSQFPTKKEIVFPPDSVEAVQPQLAKRRRLTHKDLGPVEAWRLMMALKSGLLSESTWALDTLNVLLFDDTTVAYFHLSHLPGLLEVLTEHFRASLIRIFSIMRDLELMGKRKILYPCPHHSTIEHANVDASGDHAELIDGADHQLSQSHVDGDTCEGCQCPVMTKEAYEARLDSNTPFGNYTMVSRQGKALRLEENSTDRAVLDEKSWDVFCNFESGSKHWQKGRGDITQHVVPCFESGVTHKLLSELFYCCRTKKCRNGTGAVSDSGAAQDRVRKAASKDGVVDSRQCSRSVKTECVKECKQETQDADTETPVLLKDEKENHSAVCDREVHRNNFMKKLEIKTEPRDSELQRCESDDSLPPPDLPAATQEKSANEEGMELGSGEEGKEDSEEKAAPDLTCETDAVQGRSKNEGEGESSTVANGENCKKEDTSDNSAESAAQENVNTENTSSEDQAATETEEESAAEAAAAVMKEQDNGLEEETYHHDDAPLCTTQADHEELGRRCVAISNIFRSLSCIPGNEAILSRHYGLLAVLGRLLLLHHWHPPRAKAQPAPPLPKEGDGEENAEKDDAPEPMEVECTELAEEGEKDWAMSPEWWWDTLEAIRENTLVILANICSHMKMADMEQDVCLPILDGLLHWAVCPSSCACDPLPSAPQTSMLSPQRLVLEALCKLCIHDDNVDLLLATPPFSRLILLMSRLVRFLADRSQPVPREFSIVLLSRLVQGDPVAARAIALQHPSISLLIDFLESAEQSAMAVASQQGFSVLQNNPEMMGTSLDMLRRAATTLLHLARVPENRKLFLHHQSRLLTLVMSQILDTGVTQIVSDVLFECSQSAAPLT